MTESDLRHWLANAKWAHQYLSTLKSPTGTERDYHKDLSLFIPMVQYLLEHQYIREQICRAIRK